MTHQLLPKEEWTKAEDVRLPLGAFKPHTNVVTGRPLSYRSHQGYRVGDGRARGPRGNGHNQEEGKRIERTLECGYENELEFCELGWTNRYRGCAIECNTSFLNQAISIAFGLVHFAECLRLQR